MIGTVKQDASGRWYYQFTVKVDGRRKHVRKRGFATKKAAHAHLIERLAEYGKGNRRALAAPSAQPLGDYLDGWLAARRVAGDGLKPATAASYDMVCRVYLAPLRPTPLRDLTGDQISRWHARLRTSGGKVGKDGTRRPLSARTGAYASRVLAMALNDAVEAGKLVRSPFEEIPTRQRPTRHKQRQQLGKVWAADQARAFLEAETVRSDRLYALWALLLESGARRGEALGLRWSDVGDTWVEIARNRVLVDDDVIEGTPKGGDARRVELHPGTLAALRRWRAAQAAERLAAGPAWTDTGYVFTDELGEPLRPDSVSGRFERLVKHLDVPPVSLHALRHTSGTMALLAGVPLHVVAARLGHDPAVLIKLYAHVLAGNDREASDRMGGSLYGEAPMTG